MYLRVMLKRPSIAIQAFDYELPDAKIAYTPASKRSASKLLVWDKKIIAETTYASIDELIPPHATLLFNNSKVIAARLLFEKTINPLFQEEIHQRNSVIEIFCLEPSSAYMPVVLAMQATEKVEWICLVGGAKKWKTEYITKTLSYHQKLVTLKAKRLHQEDGKFLIEFSWDDPSLHFSEILTLIGNIPLPPYIQREITEEDKDRYQTTYAIEEGSVAAPTAGLHFNDEVFEKLDAKKIKTDFVTLHVGAGTFMPVKALTIDEHIMHAEFIEVPITLVENFIAHFNKKNKTPIIAVGTTTLRTIESLYWLGVKLFDQNFMEREVPVNEFSLAQWDDQLLSKYNMEQSVALTYLLQWMIKNEIKKIITKTQLMITPGYQFRMCNALVTNFHQPKSTLLLIIAAITGNEWRNIYAHALENHYRFLSYGDGCLLWIKQ